MTPVWHPLSALLLPDGLSFAPPLLLRRLLGKPRTLTYAGDRMWPAVGHGAGVECAPLEGPPVPGDVVVVCPGGIPDLLRVESIDGERCLLRGDADPGEPFVAARQEILARALLPAVRVSRWRRAARRLRIDLREAARGLAAGRDDPAFTVRDKYEAQAPFYEGSAPDASGEEFLALLHEEAPGRGRILVAGSGTGRECLALARTGRQVVGVDFAPAMVTRARQAAQREGLAVEFHLADLRRHRERPGSCAAVLFTYDAYSFLPDAADRVALLAEMRGWLAPGGVVLLSARRAGGAYARFVLTLELLAGGARCWGGSHTRWIGADGRLQRSFIQVFSERRLRREIRRAGLAPGPWRGGHRPLRPVA